ncbi:MAG: NADH-quinone oxidoreductase subunit J [Vicinamibacteria bacterium]|nr:NADH-quinone oxidoreductase subunit J [Vicinamibacteria bacterium]
MAETILFYALAITAFSAAFAVVLQKSALGSAFALIVVLCSLSAIYGLLGSPILATLQIVIYAGAVMVLFLFVIMLLDVRREKGGGGPRSFVPLALLFAGLLVLQVGAVLVGSELVPQSAPFDGSAKAFARRLFSQDYVYVFEATSVLIVAALAGALALARRRR